jgi:hypothetical protein
MPTDQSDFAELPDFAAEWLAQRRLGQAKLEQLKLRSLREMTEADSARIFAQLDPPRPYVLRTTSGLVEQQYWFQLLWQRAQEESPSSNRERDP